MTSFPALLRLARAPVAAFAAMGILWGSFAATLPDIKSMLDVDEALMGRLLFPTPLAAVAAMLLAPAFGAALGRRALPLATLAMAGAFALPGQAAGLWVFPLAMLACGGSTGLTDVLMNARVAELETRHDLHLMNLCHAAYSFGYAGGAFGAGGLRALDWPPGAVLGVLAALAGLIALATAERDGAIGSLARPKGPQAAGLGLVPLIGGAMVLIAFLTENAAENWSALHLEQTLGAHAAGGASAPALLALTMGAARLYGQRLALRLRAERLLIGGAMVSATGALVVAGAVSPAMAYAGFVVMGLGSSVIAPTAFSLVGRHAAPRARARAVARATLFGYFGYFIGPPGFGFLAGWAGLRMAFVVAAGLLVLVPLLVRAFAAATPAPESLDAAPESP